MVERHYQQNRAPIPPDPRELEKILSQNGDDASVEADVEVGEADVKGKQPSKAATDDEEETPRAARRHSRNPFTGSTSDPKKLGFYPPQWRDVLGRAQRLWRCWMVVECCFPRKETDLDVAMECVVMALSQHQENKGKVEKGNYLSFCLRPISHFFIGFWEEYQDNMRDYVCPFL